MARAVDLDVKESAIVALSMLRPATYLGRGKVEEIGELAKTLSADIVVMDCALTPVQQRNLEKSVECQSHRPHRPDPGNIRSARPHARGRAAGRARPPDVSEKSAGALLDPPGAPTRRLRLSRRTRRNATRSRPPRDRGAARQNREGARQGQTHARPAPRQPPPRALPDRRAGRLHQCRQIDAVQPHDRGERTLCRHAVRHARSDHAGGDAAARRARSFSRIPSALFPICRPCWSRRSAPLSRK